MQYRPLPPNLTIKRSKLHGLGLFALEDIAKGTGLGIIHIKADLGLATGFDKGVIRTPLGGFINHSDTPNCSKRLCYTAYNGDPTLIYYLHTDRKIEKEEELTVKYTLYKIKWQKE